MSKLLFDQLMTTHHNLIEHASKYQPVNDSPKLLRVNQLEVESLQWQLGNLASQQALLPQDILFSLISTSYNLSPT